MAAIQIEGAGVRLTADHLPGTRRNPVVLLHGGGQTRHSWGDTAAALAAQGWETLAVDLRGHGDSEWAADGAYNPADVAADVAAVARWCSAPPVLVGASLGGMSSLLALGAADPPPAAGLVLVDVAHRFDATGAGRVVDFMGARPEGFAEPAEAEAAVAAYLPHRPHPVTAAGLAKNLRRDGDRWRWHWDPALLASGDEFLAAEAVAEFEDRLAAAAAGLAIPVLLVRGARSDVITPAIAQEFGTLAPGAELVDVAAAGHMVAGDSNDVFGTVVADFLERRIG